MVLQDFEDTERLNGIGFLDTQIYLTSIACMKHLMLLGDLCKGVWFVGFQVNSSMLLDYYYYYYRANFNNKNYDYNNVS
jgi:cleavage and polyadenylation specificity factor subunit 1